MEEINQDLINSFRAPAFPGSFFLSFEGIEGAGKSTQIVKIKEFLESKNFRVLVLREPGGTPFGEKLRSAILNTKTALHPVAEAHLFAASRAQLLEEVTLRELSIPNTVIICDRYIDSTLAYQGTARKLGLKTILDMHNCFPLNLVPHLTFYLKISIETSQERQKMRNAPKDYFESQGLDFYKSLVEGYENSYKLFPKRIKLIDAEKNSDEVYESILKELMNLLEN
ncbi:MAG: dTMP kinase [Bdellovibrionales bacterium]|jgi:dTMP kinase|nr:dTMP kinase [Bdellovibrionales bacterium]